MKSVVALAVMLCLISSVIAKSNHKSDEVDESRSAFKQVHHKKTLQDEPAYLKLEQIQEHPLGAKILQTIALQMKSKGGLGSISTLLQDLRTDLEAKQIDSDLEKTTIVGQCRKDLENYSQRVSLAVSDIKDSEFKAKRLNEAIELYDEEIEEKVRQIDVLQNKDDTLRATRIQDSLDYSGRTEQMNEMVQAFEVILPKLQAVYNAVESSQTEFSEIDSITLALVELARIGSQNPITSMVALTSALEPSAVQTLIEKMQDIRDSIKESIKIEDESEAKHAQVNEIILGAIFDALENLTIEKSSDQEALEETTTNRDTQEKRARDAHSDYQAAKNGNDQRRSQCEQYQTQYEENTIERSKQIDIIKTVQNIIATKLEVVASYVEENNLF